MKKRYLIFCFIVGNFVVSAQERYKVIGVVKDQISKENILHAQIKIEGVSAYSFKTLDEKFELTIKRPGNYILSIMAPEYVGKRIPILIETTGLDLGTLYMERDITFEKGDNVIMLTEADIEDERTASFPSGMLQATKDVFLNRAAFDFGQAFFRVRGYGSENGMVLLNGMPMNKIFNGRPQWNNWGGLNDVTRNQEFTHGLVASDYSFGRILGTTNIDTRASGFRKGLRVSTSASNRTYAGRLMATYSSGWQRNGFAYSISASRRWAKEGYMDGTLYDAYSFFAAMEYRVNEKNSFNATAVLAANRRGKSSAITEEVFGIVGRHYNPYWGYQNGEIRNSRERKILEPIGMLNHFYRSERLSVNTGVSYQFGTLEQSRLGYFNAPNPDPTYYRYLPSYYINSPIGANFISANMAREGLIQNPQLSWSKVYGANAILALNGKAAYLFYKDVTDEKQFQFNSIANYRINDRLKVSFGGNYRNIESDNYAGINDLLGAQFHEDKDPFSETNNDMEGELNKVSGDKFNYFYKLNSSVMEGFLQAELRSLKWEGFVAANLSVTDYQRDGKFKNQRYLENSLGKSDALNFSNFGGKAGVTYKLNGRHWMVLHGAYMTKAPLLQNVFINPRENNQTVDNLQNEHIATTDFNYYMRLPNVTARLSGFYTRFQNTTDINFFFVDAGVGSDFVQEVITDLDKLHMGTELGLEYQVSAAVKLTMVSAIGKYLYASDPLVSINFDTAGTQEDIINPLGSVDLGNAKIKDYKLGQGPQKAMAFGVEYRDPKYWWVAATTNYLTNNYAGISTITRTKSFYLDPETGRPFPEATEENVQKLLAQQKLDDIYLLNVIGGKSWLRKGTYISVFASVSNVFDAVFRTGGYEQSRNGNFGQWQQDNLSGSPSFAPKYWYGYGRSYFLNFAISF
ncbi:TonB-dependent Receptor Plug Domain [Arenibacter nanhaiticus]|uniref:TonB-dependent Receptor Plug Domain n=1 Tax=Arenibacter nanhaiticus TaxID=558155 RepID=A0A1M6D658_9FLAO|nr:TonB-dependent receptor plug domain-containing protein [Arenibacter nanhaiticus]SHI68706.1 TonB-dependent Receptor Plug Domain [Arenibacter nanhaiticus]